MKRGIYIFSTIVLGIGVILLISLFTPNPNSIKNGFTRKEIKILYPNIYNKKNSDIWNIIGKDSTLIYLQGSSPSLIYKINDKLNNIDTMHVDVPDPVNIDNNFEYYSNSLTKFNWLFSKENKLISKINFHTKSSTTYQLKYLYTRFAVIDSSRIAVKIFDTSIFKLDPTFSIYNFSTGKVLKERNVTNPHNDAGISEDAFLNFDPSTSQLINVGMYNNKIIYMDTLLRVLGVGQTIDTFSIANIFIGSPSAKNDALKSMSFSRPPKIVNNYSDVSAGVLYVASAVRADNDYEADSSLTPIDLYNQSSRNYIGTLYLKQTEKQKILQFRVFGKQIIALSKDYISIFTIPDIK